MTQEITLVPSTLTEPTEDKKKRSLSASSSPILSQGIVPDEDTDYVALTRKLNTSRIRLAFDQVEQETESTCCFQVPLKNPYFTGRVTLLSEVAQQLHSQHASLITQSIIGLGGVGKTQLAGHYAQLAVEGATCGDQKLNYKAVLWLYAEQVLGVQFQAMAELWCKRNDLSEQEAVRVVYAWLQDKPALIVFDNATHADALTAFLPPAGEKGSRAHHILLTSRNPDWPRIPTLPLGVFTQEEARLYVCKRLPKACHSEIDALVASVSNLPLALSHAVAYIAEGHCTLANYPSQFALHQLSPGRQVADAESTVLSTFLLTTACLQLKCPAVSLILQTTAYLAPEGIEFSLLHKKLAERQSTYSAEQLKQGVAILIRHDLLHIRKDGCLNMHRLVQQVIRNQLSRTEQHLRLTAVLEFVGLVYPEKGQGHPAEAARKMLIPHLKALIEHQDSSGRQEDKHLALVLDLLGDVYADLGDVAKKRDLLLRVLKIDETNEDNLQLAITLANLGIVYRALGDVNQALVLLQRALEIHEGHYGLDDLRLIIILTSLGKVYGDLGEVKQQCNVLLRALAIQETHYGTDHWKLAQTLVQLGNAYGALDDTTRALDFLLRALKIKETHYGSDHPEVAITLANLAVMYKALKEPKAALLAAQRAYHIMVSHPHYGEQNPLTQRYLKYLQSAGFTLEQLRTPSKQTDEKGRKQTPQQIPPISTILSATHFAPPSHSSTSNKIGQAVVGLVDTIAQQFGAQPDDQVPAKFVSDIVSACAKGKAVLEQQLKELELNSLLKELVPYIRNYLLKHPILYKLDAHQDLAEYLEKALCMGRLQDLRQQYGSLPLDEKSTPKSNTCLVM